ncbi:MAG: sugar phosphate isomerase/epimerase family protein [Anaerolineae bacterium]
MIHGIGINADHEYVDGQLSVLEQLLDKYRSAGFDSVEISVPGLNAIRGGTLVEQEATRVRQMLRDHGLGVTLHSPNALSLIRNERHSQVMESMLRLAEVLGATRIVYHSAQIALRAPYRHLAPLPSDDELRAMWERETEALIAMGRRAADMGLTLCVENRDPHLWEISALGMHGRPASQLVHYHQGMRLDLLARQMEAVNLPNVGICLDVGHAFLAAPYWPDPDYLAAIRACAPWVNHLHFHDNFGRVDDDSETIGERLVFGEADNHLPPGWGKIPLEAVLTALKEAHYDGLMVLELRPRYLPYLEEALATTRRLLAKTGLNGA